MADDDKRESDPGRMSAPPPDFDEDLVTQLTPNDELARWRRISARDEKPVFVKDPAPPPSRPALPGTSPGPRPEENTPARPLGAPEKTPARGVAAVGATPARGVAAVERTPPRGVFVASPSPAGDARAHLRDAPIAFPGQPPRISSPPLSPRTSPVPAAPLPTRASARPTGLTGLAEGGARPQGVFGVPRPSDEAASPIPLPERSGFPAAPPSAHSSAFGAPTPPISSPAPAVNSLAPPAAFKFVHKPALAPPPPSLSLPPRHEPSIPPAARIGVESPSLAPPVAAMTPRHRVRSYVSFVALVVIVGAIIGARYLARTPGILSTPVAPVPSVAPSVAPPLAAVVGPAPSVAPVPSAEPGIGPAAPPVPTALPVAPAEPVEPPSIVALLEVADVALRAGDAEAALTGYRAAIEADGHDPYGFAGAARALLALDRPEEAISFATRAVAHRQRRAAFRILLGDAYEAHREHARAREEWRIALAIEPENRVAAARLGE